MEQTKNHRGRFQKGADSRRHKFTQEECQRGGREGFQAMLVSIITRYPDALDRNGRHMACNALPALLKRKGR